MRELKFRGRQEAEVAYKQIAKTSMTPVVLLSAAISLHPLAKYFEAYIKTHPSRAEVAAIQQEALRVALQREMQPNGSEKKWDLVITDPSCRLEDPLEAQWSIPLLTMTCRIKVIEALTMGRAREPPYGRGDTRIREDNTWLIEKAVLPKKEQWVFTVLPAGKRVILVYPGEANWVEVLDRDTLAPITDPDFKLSGGPCTAINSALDCLVTSSGEVHVFDSIYVWGKSTCHLPLLERMRVVPETNMYAKLEYSPVSLSSSSSSASSETETVYNVANEITREDGRRVLLVDSLAPYKPNSRSAITWRPPHPANSAILCVRVGEAMAVLSQDDAWLVPVGNVAAESVYSHMGAYVCIYDNGQKVWIISEKAKRKEALFTYWQAMDVVRSCKKVPDGAGVFEVLSRTMPTGKHPK